jgi:putative nucleotidyltransferase with HDIG domain
MADIVGERLSQIEGWRAPAFQALLDALLAERSPIYVVGGNVRDYLRGSDETTTDLDLVMAPPVLELARRVADRLGWAYYPLDQQRDVARLVLIEGDEERLVCDVAAVRGNLDQDLHSRDFTINSLALALTADAPPYLIDVCDGVNDLRQHRLRPAAEENLDRDPLRMLRAVRFAYKLGLHVDAEVKAQIRRRAAAITKVSAERLRDELWKILSLPQPAEAVEMIAELGMLHYVLPELVDTVGVEQSPPHHLDVYEHTLLVMNNAATLRDWLQDRQTDLEPPILAALANWDGDLRRHFAESLSSEHARADWLVWHALFHDVGKPATRTEETTGDGETRYRFFDHETIGAKMTARRLANLRFSRPEVQLGEHVVAAHMRPHHLHLSFPGKPISRRAAYRFFRDTASGVTGERTAIDILLLALADRQATGNDRGEDWRCFLGHISHLLDFGFRPLPGANEPLLNGQKLMATFNLESGPLIGQLLARLTEAQATGEITSVGEATNLVAQLLENSPMKRNECDLD